LEEKIVTRKLQSSCASKCYRAITGAFRSRPAANKTDSDLRGRLAEIPPPLTLYLPAHARTIP